MKRISTLAAVVALAAFGHTAFAAPAPSEAANVQNVNALEDAMIEDAAIADAGSPVQRHRGPKVKNPPKKMKGPKERSKKK